MFGKDERFVDFSAHGMQNQSISRQEILYNRAVAFCGLGLYHRAR
jgi:hypothetical protein